MMSTENQIPSQEWLEKYEKVKSILVPPVSFEEIYSQKEAFGKKLFILNMGEIHFPTGEIFRFDGKLLKNKFLQKKRAERE